MLVLGGLFCWMRPGLFDFDDHGHAVCHASISKLIALVFPGPPRGERANMNYLCCSEEQLQTGEKRGGFAVFHAEIPGRGCAEISPMRSFPGTLALFSYFCRNVPCAFQVDRSWLTSELFAEKQNRFKRRFFRRISCLYGQHRHHTNKKV